MLINNSFGINIKRKLSLFFVIMTYLTAQAQLYHDTALFNAPFGDVEQIQYQDGIVCFKEDGQLDKEASTYLSYYKLYKIERDADGYPIKLTTDYDVTTLEYDNNHRISRRTIKAGDTTVKEYDFSNLQEVTEITITFEAGQPKREVKRYDDIRFDAWNNWTRKGLKGTTIQETDYEYVHVGTIGDGYTDTHLSTKNKTIGATEENRNIHYRSNDNFTCGQSANDVCVLDALKDPFFIGVGQQRVEGFLKTLKNHKDLGEVIKGYSGHRMVIRKETGHTCCGLPLQYYSADFFKSAKWIMVKYSFLIATKDSKQTHQLFNHLTKYFVEQGCDVQQYMDKETVTVAYGEGNSKLRLFKHPLGLFVYADGLGNYPSDTYLALPKE